MIHKRRTALEHSVKIFYRARTSFMAPTSSLVIITLESYALNQHYLPKMCIELALPLLDFEKVMY